MRDTRVTRLKKLLANYTRGSLFVASVDDDVVRLRAMNGGEWTADIGTLLVALVSLVAQPGFAEPDEGCRELLRYLASRVQWSGPPV